jgi:ATP-dependent 26S proteasome regulatory subunit
VEEQSSPTTPIFLNTDANNTVRDFIADANHVDTLSKQGLSSRLSMLVFGPPGTGKTLLAGHIANRLGRPLYIVRLDSLISSLLGDTAKNVRAIFDFAPAKNSVLFLDEMDAIAKLRDDRHELGELKRVLNTVLQGIDSLDDYSILIGATNHPQLLDRAIWRRFPYKIELSQPDHDVRNAMWRHFLFADQEHEAADLLAQISEGLTGADIETISQSARRHIVLAGRPLDLVGVVQSIVMTNTNAPSLPPRDELSLKSKRTLALLLAEQGLNAPKIAKLTGVTRQWARKLLKEAESG